MKRFKKGLAIFAIAAVVSIAGIQMSKVNDTADPGRGFSINI